MSQLYIREINVVIRAGVAAINATELTSMVSHQRGCGDTCELRALSVELFYYRYTSIGLVLTTLNETRSRFCFFFYQPWTDNGPDGRHGRCVGAPVRTRGGDCATIRHPATVDDPAKAGTSTWRIALAACATVSHRQTSLCLDCAFRRSQSF